MTYHISWLKKAINNYEDSSINGNMTIDEFIKTWCSEELEKVIELP